MTSSSNKGEYNFTEIEKKWQKYWLEHKTFKSIDHDPKPKFYCLDMFPYPSGDGLHVGHLEGYTATDILCRYKRMQGYNVLHPIGWDAFGLPAEQYAIKNGVHPRITTDKNIKHFKEQIQSLGFSYDWDREIDTTDPKYYKWTQWIFLQLFKKGLAYESYEPVNWCPALGTVLANEEVIDGKSEIGGFDVIKKPMRQWVLKITEYAQRLLEDLDELDWPESIKNMQKNWIGRSEGAEIVFKIYQSEDKLLKVFTTRPDTLYGATFMVLAPEHPLVKEITTPEYKQSVEKYIAQTLSKSDKSRIANLDKTGVFTGAYAINPVNHAKLPIWIADYVLMSYGYGAIMAVPGHDQRDHDFAKKFNLNIIRVLTGGHENINEKAHEGDGYLINSEFLNGLTKDAAIKKMTEWLEKNKVGKYAVNYKLKDWLFSRQRYWGEPFPLLRDKNGKVHYVDDKDLPVLLPQLEDFKPTGTEEPPLSKAKDWVKYIENGKEYTRETNTMPQWAGSCWYYLRYIDPYNDKEPWDKEKEKYWMPVDLYVGGAEHAVLHLLYARFWHKVLYDLGYVSTKEPFKKLVNQGMILGENNEKMSKSRGNVVNPDEVIKEWGADSIRLYEMFMGPLEATKPWQTKGIIGIFRFIKRIWRLYITESGEISSKINNIQPSLEIKKLFHKTIKKITEDTENLRFNTAISSMMEFVNAIYKEDFFNRDIAEKFILLISPYAPHLAEELWKRMGHTQTLAYESWPSYDPALTQDNIVTITIQVNGKLRGVIEVDKNEDKTSIIQKAKNLNSVKRHLENKIIVKEIFIPQKILNFVVK